VERPRSGGETPPSLWRGGGGEKKAGEGSRDRDKTGGHYMVGW